MATEATCDSTVIDNTEKSPHHLSLLHIMLFIKLLTNLNLSFDKCGSKENR